ncbi:MAG: M1 family aminopeptidase [Gemmataceae bacterium]
MRVCAAMIGVALFASSASAGVLAPPPDLPHYDLAIRLDTSAHVATVRQRVTWTNRSSRPTAELVFNVYPRYKIDPKDITVIAKTIELLRQDPRVALDVEGRAGNVTAVRLENGATLATYWQQKVETALTVALPHPVGPGECITVDLDYIIRLPHKQGRWGWWDDVCYFNHWHPTLAFYDDMGWQPTPLVPWHQPFFLEAGVYRATIDVPLGQVIACSAPLSRPMDLGNGWTRYESDAAIVRDFSLTASNRYREFCGEADGTTVRVLALPEHEWYAREMVKMAQECIPVYNRWFGPIPYKHFTIAESFFPWNGNECGALVLIDHRVFMMPHLARGYVDYLVAHEILHQWWYNAVGTDGYRETWMDEGVATYFSHRYMNQKVGRNSAMLEYPAGFQWLPNIHRENYRFSSRAGSIRRGDDVPAVAPTMEDFGSVVGLFSGAYDRGSKLIGMIEDRLGEAATFDFFRRLYCRYYFRVMRVADFRRELEEYTGQSWADYFRNWVYGKGLTDWKIERVECDRAPAGTARPVTVMLRQQAQIDEPTVLGLQFGNCDTCQIRIPIVPGTGRTVQADPPATVECLPDHRVKVTIQLTEEPAQIAVDPDQILEDAEPANNRWHQRERWRITPLYTQIDEADLLNDYDRWNFIVGPWVYASASKDPWFQRSSYAGVRAGAFRTQQFGGGTYLAFRSDYRDLVVGADGLIDHWPLPKSQLGFLVENRIGGPYFGGDGPDGALRAVVYARYIFLYTGSLYMNPLHYVEGFGTYQDNQLPFARQSPNGAVRPEHSSGAGIHYHLDLLTPYWFPRYGFRVDATYTGGNVVLPGSSEPMHRLELQAAAAHGLPEALGWLGETTVAGQLSLATSVPDQAQFFALGGSTFFRGFDLAERQGSTVWAANLEWRIPVMTGLNFDVCDHIAGLRNVYAAAFYDVGAAYANGKVVDNVAHAIGGGVRLDVAWFSFIERTTIRLDVAKTVNASSPVQLWLGIQYAF